MGIDVSGPTAKGSGPHLRAHQSQYPSSEIYHFAPLNERVEVFSKPFRISTDVTILATPDAQKLLAEQDSVSIGGAVEYHAYDDKICYNPARVPVSFVLKVKPLDRKPQAADLPAKEVGCASAATWYRRARSIPQR